MNVTELIAKNYSKLEHDLTIISIIIKFVNTRLSTDLYQDQVKKFNYTFDLFNLLEHYQRLYDETFDISYYHILENNFYSITEGISDLKEDLLPLVKITSALFLENLKKTELENFKETFFRIMETFSNINEASKYVYYHANKNVSSFVTKLVNYLDINKINNRLIPIDFLKQYQNVITLHYSDWIKLYQNINITMKLINSTDDIYNELKKEFLLLQVYYFITLTGDENV